MPISRRRPPLPLRTSSDPRRGSRSRSPSASASWMRSPPRQSTTISARSLNAVAIVAGLRASPRRSPPRSAGRRDSAAPCCGAGVRRDSRACVAGERRRPAASSTDRDGHGILLPIAQRTEPAALPALAHLAVCSRSRFAPTQRKSGGALSRRPTLVRSEHAADRRSGARVRAEQAAGALDTPALPRLPAARRAAAALPPRRPALAPAHLDAWLAWAARSRLRPFVRLARTLRAHRDGILAAIRLGLSNGRLEGLNSKIRLISHRAFGFHSADPLIALVYLCCAGITIELPR